MPPNPPFTFRRRFPTVSVSSRSYRGRLPDVQLTVTHSPSAVDPTVTAVVVAGEVDLATAGHLRAGLETAEAVSSTGLVVDLRRVGFIDSTGIGELVGCHRRCRERSVPLAFIVPEGTIDKILKVTGMDAVFDIHRDEETATRSVTSHDSTASADD